MANTNVGKEFTFTNCNNSKKKTFTIKEGKNVSKEFISAFYADENRTEEECAWIDDTIAKISQEITEPTTSKNGKEISVEIRQFYKLREEFIKHFEETLGLKKKSNKKLSFFESFGWRTFSKNENN